MERGRAAADEVLARAAETGSTRARAIESTSRGSSPAEGFIQGFVGLGAAYAREDPPRAARLLGRGDVLLEEAASENQQFEGRVRDETEAELRARLGEDAYAAVYAEGRALALEDALALALRPG